MAAAGAQYGAAGRQSEQLLLELVAGCGHERVAGLEAAARNTCSESAGDTGCQQMSPMQPRVGCRCSPSDAGRSIKFNRLMYSWTAAKLYCPVWHPSAGMHRRFVSGRCHVQWELQPLR